MEPKQEKKAPEKTKWTDIKNSSGQKLILVILAVFFCLLLAVILLLGREYLWVPEKIQEGSISRNNIYAPFDFNFKGINGDRIEVKKNELIIQRGERINKTQELALLGLQKLQRQPKKLYYLLGIILLLIIFAVFSVVYINIYGPKVILKTKNVLLLCILSLFAVVITKATVISSVSLYLIPLASFSMLVAILIGPGMAFMFTVIMSVFVGILTGGRFELMVTMLAGGIVSIYAVLNVRRRRSLTKAGVLIGLTNMVSIVGMGLINFIPLNNLVVRSCWGLANGIISAIIVTGVLPIFEILFNITTNISLLELSDLNQPVLKELVMKAPGTYHHSLVVGNLAESAAEAVGANSLLSRVGGYFHDIGKLRMAPYFSENQNFAEDKHENLSPSISSLIIINHIKEGVELAKKYRLGQEIIDIITQHHGMDVVYYFYHRALGQHSEEKAKVEAEDFRYSGPKPQSKEAAIVMLADSVEAASKSLPQRTPAKIQDLVNRIINNKFIDGQLDECDLTLKDLHIIAEVFTHILNGIFHARVEYPNLNLNQDSNEQYKNKELSEKDKSQSGEAKKNSKRDPQK
ncbi:MAG: HDIG domain-containing protein [Candidatus Omnitrophica bacterium]|nr:HDIG domain-containing protein [Candidatus Omnitrophota bacterium]